jgi:hypothetical protein
MSTCEQCGTTFAPPTGPVEVTSTRVLCPACAEARRIQKARAASAQQAARASASTPPSPARPGTPAAAPPRAAGANPSSAQPARASAANPASPAPRPATAPAATPKPAARPNPGPATPVPARKPPPNPPAAAAPATPVPARALAAKPAPLPERAAPAKAPPSPTKPAPAPAKPALQARGKRAVDEEEHDEDEQPRHSKDVERGAQLLRKKESKVTAIMWVLALVLTGVASAAVYVMKERQKKEADARQAHADEVKALWDQMEGFDISTDEGAQQMILLADDKRELWSGEAIEGDVTSRRAKAAKNLEISAERKSLRDRLTAIETALQDPEALSAETLAQQRRNIEELEPAARVELVGAEYLSKLGALRTSASRVYATKLLDEAKTAGRADPSRESLAIYSRAESEIQKLFDKSHKEDKESKDFYEGLYRDVIKSSDALCAQVFTPEVIEKTPWIDLLNGEWAAKWQRAEVRGFQHSFEGGALKIIGPEADSNKQGVLAVGLNENWRDFVLDVEYTIEKGKVTFDFRMRVEQPDNAYGYEIDTEGDGAILAGEPYTAEMSLIGSSFVYREEASLDSAPFTQEVSWTKSRAGALRLVIPDGTQLKISRLRIRVLR